MPHKRPEEKENFLNHLRYLLSLSRRQRYNRDDWQEMVKILTAAGYWRRKKRITDKRGSRKLHIGS